MLSGLAEALLGGDAALIRLQIDQGATLFGLRVSEGGDVELGRVEGRPLCLVGALPPAAEEWARGVKACLALHEERWLRRAWDDLLESLDQGKPGMARVVQALARSVPGTDVSLFWLLHGRLRLSATTDDALRLKARASDVSYAPTEGLTGKAFTSNGVLRFVNANDPNETTPVAPDRSGPLHPESNGLDGRVQRSLIVPVRKGGRAEGVVRVSRNLPHPPFSDAEVRLVEQFASLLGPHMSEIWQRLLFDCLWDTPGLSVIVARARGGTASRPTEVVDASAGVKTLLGYDPARLRGKPARELYVDPTAAKRAFVDRKPGPRRLVARRADGGALPISIHYQGLENRLVEPPEHYSIGIAVDDTARVGAEQDRAAFGSMLDGLDVAYFRADLGGRSRLVLGAEERLTGFGPGSLADRRDLWQNPLERARLIARLQASPDRKLKDEIVKLRRRDRATLTVGADLRIVADPDTGEELLEGIYRDLSGRMALQASLNAGVDRLLDDRELLERLVTQQEAQQVFIASVGHQLMAPLANLVESLRSLERGQVAPEDVQPRLVRLVARTRRCLDIVRGLSTLHDVLRGAAVRPRLIDVSRIVQQLADDFRPRLRQSGVQIETTGADRPRMVSADADLLRQVLYNLLDNAGKYGAPREPVRLRVSHGRPSVDVWNTGMPILAEERERIWEKGYRTRRARRAQAQGTGLGLFLVRELCRAMGAVATVDVVEDGGRPWNVFRVSFAR